MHAAPDAELLTSLQVRRALDGDAASLAWIVARFSPLLLAQARYRLGTRLRQLYEPADVVNDVWLRTLPRLQGLSANQGRYTPVILKFLTTTLLHRVSDLFDKHLRGKPAELEAAASAEGSDAPTPPPVATESTGIVSHAVRAENNQALWRALDDLAAPDREVLVLRGIEQRSNSEVAALLGIDSDAASKRYRRALERVRACLPESLWVELVD